METKKNPKEFPSLFELLKLTAIDLPPVFVYVGEDSFEYEIAVDHYKEKLESLGNQLDIIVIVAEGGEYEQFFADLFTPDMFYPDKLIILKNGSLFFKPLLETKSNSEFKDYIVGFQKNISQLGDNVHLLIHYDQKDLPSSFQTLFKGEYVYYKPKPIYPQDAPKVIREVLDQEKVQMEEEAFHEFLHRIPANLGAYLKNIRKLKAIFKKTKFTLADIHSALFTQKEMNATALVESLLQGKKADYFKEFTKFNDDNSEILQFLTRCLYKLDEIRKIRIIKSKHNGEVPIPIMDEILKTGSFSEARKGFMRKQLLAEAKHFTDKSINQLYDLLIEMNMKFKSGLRDEEGRVYFIQKSLAMFQLIHSSSK
ncbi:putative DNA polymerase III, delta subunit [Leptospira ryugenii]|uniref:Putative DNA polymerase III, delta subunit n=1 Tax=Leptospira ryugenii TaxID=1917863 RepID=A0A2P2E3B3_9LEPT|nr:DNA polymerase III subunit delta [Leptospira ryugenii]GBF51324.1 putative DNA polymerase III, delta subunit [Leptospira ryugenii]